jgi:threonine/homoserine/homoserine lactone efflux protein
MPIAIADLLVFLSASLLLNLTPGNDMMFVIGQSLRGGVRSGIAASFGVATGSLIHLGLVALGAAVLLAKHPMLFDAMRYLGAAYLVFLAVQSLRGGAGIFHPQTEERGGLTAWRDGMLVNLFNPKTIVFMFAFLPPFVRPENGSPLLQLLIFGTIFNLGGTLINCAAAVFASHSAGFFSSNVKIAKGFMQFSAGLFLVLAARMVFDTK